MFESKSRPRRNRWSEGRRRLAQDVRLNTEDLVLPVFVCEGDSTREPIASMPGHSRLGIQPLIELAHRASEKGIPGLALFPALSESKKDSRATESKNPDGLFPTAIRKLKEALPEIVLFTDVAMDPYSSDGHDGLVNGNQILNDESLPILADMALVQAQAGADYIAPSDMMDGRVGYIRQALDEHHLQHVGIMSYTAKYASAFYGPFRDALDSAPKFGDKKTYQMNPANRKEALRELALDLEEGADIVMVKPAHTYLDIIRLFHEHSTVPVSAYHVSGEYSMLKAAAEKGWLDFEATALESLTAIKRAGADLIFTYAALELADRLK